MQALHSITGGSCARSYSWCSMLVLAAVSICPSSVVFAQAYPAKSVTLIVPFPPGGRTDITARAVAQFLKDEVGQTVVVVNKPGASGVLGAKDVSSSAPDGYTLGFFSTGFLTTQYTVPTPTSVREYELISLINYDPAAIAVNATKWKTVGELVAFAKKSPGAVKVGINAGSSAHIFAAAFAAQAGIDVVYVPFRGGGERTPALAGGHIDADFDIVAPMKPLADAGKIRILGIASDRRSDLYKDIPTMKEQGVDLNIASWHGIFAPKGTPPAVVAAMSAALAKVARNAKFNEQMSSLALGVRYMDQREFPKFFAEQDALFKTLIDKLGLGVPAKP